MGLQSSIEIKGIFLNNKTLFDFLKELPLKIKLVHNGELQIGINDDNGIFDECKYISFTEQSNRQTLDFIQKQKKLATLFIGIELDSEWHFFDFFFSNSSNSIDFSIVGNRKKIDHRYTDFSFYYKHLVKILVREDFQIGSINYTDLDF